MTAKTPLRAIKDGNGVITGFSEYQSGEFLSVAQGGTGAVTASAARTALGVSIGSDIQAYDADLAAIAALSHEDSKFIVSDGTTWVTESGATARASLGLTIGSDVQAYDQQLTDVAGLTPTDGKVIIGDGSNFVTESGSTLRTSLGLAIGSDVQAHDSDLDTIAGLTPTANHIIVGNGSAWTSTISPTFTNLTVTGNLDVQTEILNTQSTIVVIDDAFVKLNTGNSEVDAGIIVDTSDTDDARLFYDVSANRWVLGENQSYDEILTQTSTDTITNKTISGSANTISNIGNGALTNSSITVSDGSSTTDVSLGGTVTFTGGAGVDISESSGTLTFTTDLSEVTADLNERIDDQVAALLVDATTSGIDISYVDSSNELTLTVDLSEITEAFTDKVGGMVTGGTESFINVEYDDDNDRFNFTVATKDEDDMSSNSDTHLPTQQSVKAYVDTETANVASDTMTLTNKTFDVEGTGNSISNIDVADFKSGVLDTDISSVSGSDDTLASAKAIKTYVDAQIATEDTLAELNDTNITSPADGALLFYDNDNSVWIDNVVSGDITIADTGVATIAAGAVDNDMLAGSIANAKLANSSIVVGGVTLNLGDTDATPAFDLTDATNYPTSSLTGTITNTQLAGSIANAKLVNSKIVVSDSESTPNTSDIDLGGTLTFAGTANEVTVLENAGTVTIGLPDNVTIGSNLTVTGNLDVNGTTTTIDTTNTTVTDTLIELANGTSGSPSNDAGIVIERGSADNAFIGFDESEDRFIVGTGSFTGASTGNLTISTGTLVANLEGNVTGNVSGTSGSTTGNAATATALETARTIGGVSFDGTANIDLPGVNTAGNQNTTGSAATLTTARTIAGVSFDGSANISLASTDLSDTANIILTTNTKTLTNKTIDLTDNTVTGTLAEFNTAVSDATLVDLAASQTLTNKTINLENNKVIVEYAVTVSSGNFLIDNEANATISFSPGIVYRFDLSDNSVGSHPFKLSITSDGSHNSGSEYTTGKTDSGVSQGSSGSYVEYTVNAATPDILYYYCSSHSGMGGAITVFGSSYGDSDVQAISINNVVEDTTPQLGGNLDINSNNITGTGDIDTTGSLTLTSTSDTSAAGPIINLVRDSASPADADYLGQIKFKGDDDGGASTVYAKITGKIDDASAGTEDGLIEFATIKNGSSNIAARLKTTNFQLLNGTGLEVAGNATITGDLTVNGTTTTIDTTNTVVTDSLIELGNGTSGSPANDSGIVIERGSSDNAFIGWDESEDKFILGTGSFTGASTGNLTISTGTLVAALEGNASTATALATGRTIGMTGDVVWTSASFDGSGNVTGTAAIQSDAVETAMVNANVISGQSVYSGSVDTSNDFVLIYDHSTTSLKKIAVSDLNSASGAGTMSSFTLAGDSGSSQTIADGNTLTIAGGTNLSSVASGTDTVTINLDTETIQDIVGAMLVTNGSHSGISFAYQDSDADGAIDATVTATGTVTEAFKTIAVSGEDNVVADGATDTLTFVAGTNITLGTDASADSITINATGGAANAFSTIAVSGQSNVVADASTDTLTLVAGTGMTIDTDASNDTITFTSSGGGGGTLPFTAFDGSNTSTDNIVLSSAATAGPSNFS